MLNKSSKLNGSRRVDPLTLKEELMQVFPHHTVTYSVMTDTFKLTDPAFYHSLLYNTDKPSKLESVSRNFRRLAFKSNLVFLIVAIAFTWMDKKWGWEFAKQIGMEGNTVFIAILLVGIFQYLIQVINPELKKHLEREHVVMLEKMEQVLRK